ncbi:MAG: GNAT family N-acetyltransferase [Rhodospirillales bacterium]
MILIRKAVAEDAEAIARVHVATWRSTYPGLIPDSILVGLNEERHTQMWRRATGHPGGRDVVYVAEHASDGVVGFASAGPRRVDGLHFAGELYTLYVQQDHQGRGIGRRLLKRGFRALVGRGYPSALVWVLASNPSRFFYQAMGGERVGSRTEALWGVLMDEAAFGWRDLKSALDSPRFAGLSSGDEPSAGESAKDR